MPGRSIVRVVSERLAIAAGAAVTLQTALTLGLLIADERQLSEQFVRYEAGKLAQAMRPHGDDLSVSPTEALAHYSGPHAAAYAYSIGYEGGEILRSRNPQLFTGREGYEDASAEDDDFWMDRVGPGYFTVAGGEVVVVDGRRYQIAVGTTGDPDGRRFMALTDVFWSRVAWPLWPALAVIFGVATATIASALRPLSMVARAAETLEGDRAPPFLDESRLPREARVLAGAVNGLLARVEQMLAAQRRLLAATVHELRTPLAIMMLQLDHLPSGPARQLEADVERMNSTVERLMALSRLKDGQSMDPQDIDLSLVTSEVAEALAPLAHHHGTRVVVACDAATPARGDRIAVSQAVRNAIDNAIVHGRRGGAIHVTCGPGPRVVVEDDGCGIDDADIARLFEPFQRGRTPADGAGLGLSIMSEATKSAGGGVRVDRSPLGGARFTLTFG